MQQERSDLFLTALPSLRSLFVERRSVAALKLHEPSTTHPAEYRLMGKLPMLRKTRRSSRGMGGSPMVAVRRDDRSYSTDAAGAQRSFFDGVSLATIFVHRTPFGRCALAS
jgi:hypothetical protein